MKPRVYDIPAPFELAPETEPALKPTKEVASGDALQFEGLIWTVPESWSKAPMAPMRLAVYSAIDGAVELSVSRFPGDVGGDLANINRWRRQLGLSPLVDLTSVGGLSLEANGVTTGQRIELFSAGATGMYMHWFSFEEHTWFFKANGGLEALTAIRAEFDAWIVSINEAPEGE